MPSSRTLGAPVLRRWHPGGAGSSRTRQARMQERRSRSELIARGSPNGAGHSSAVDPVRGLQPAAHSGLVIPIGIAEAPFQVRLLARNHAIADRDGERQPEDLGPRTLCGYTDAAVDQKHPEI